LEATGAEQKGFERYRAIAGRAPVTYLEILFERLSIRLSYLLSYTSVTPNQLTTLSMLLGLTSAGLILHSDYRCRILGIIIWFLAWTLDFCDGEIARFRCMETEFGRWLDQVTDRLRDVALYTAVTMLAVREASSIEVSLWGLLALGGTIVYQYASTFHYQTSIPRNPQASDRQRATRFSPRKFGGVNYILMAVLLGLDLPQIFLICAAILAFSGLAVDIYSSRRTSGAESSDEGPAA